MQDLIVGMGEVGSALYSIFREYAAVCGVDCNPSKNVGEPGDQLGIMHICFPYAQDFVRWVEHWTLKYSLEELVIHSTVKPGTTAEIAAQHAFRVVYSPVRGIHSRMVPDIRRYAKFWGCSKKPIIYLDLLRRCGIRSEEMDPLALELAKIYVDTSYYGWLITYAQHTKEVADRYGIGWDEMWKFSDEIHTFLGNRPKMYPGTGIGGHCVLSNLDLVGDPFLGNIRSHDIEYRKHLEAIK